MIRRALPLSSGLWLAASAAAQADHFPPLMQVKTGAKLAVYSPELMLLAMAGGLLVAGVPVRSAVLCFVAFFVGLLAGFVGVFLWPVKANWAALVLALLFGGSVALDLRLSRWVAPSGLFLAGAISAPSAFVARYIGQTTPLVLGNFVLTMMILLALSFLICAVVRMQAVRHWWLSVVLRVFGSWAVAASTIIFAFNLTHHD